LKVVRFGVVTAKSGRDNEVSLIKIFNTKSQKSCIIAQFIEGGRIILKRAASIDARAYNGCRVWLVLDISDNKLGIGWLYVAGGIVKNHQFSCGIVRYAEMSSTIRNLMRKPALYMVWLEGIIFISLV
jgi:hypothetical protein